jgi:hypothetical protein
VVFPIPLDIIESLMNLKQKREAAITDQPREPLGIR